MLWLLTKLGHLAKSLEQEIIMGIQATLEQDKAALAATQAALVVAQEAVAAAEAVVAKDQAALDTIAPQVAAWDNIDAYVATITDDNLRVTLQNLIATGRASLGL